MLSKCKLNKGIGFMGAAKTSATAPYRQKQRSAKLRSFGEKSSFITPKTKEEQEKCPRGMKR